METIYLTELFSGIGAQTAAFKRLGIAHKATACEIDPVAHGMYEAIHGKTPNLGDITKVKSLPRTDVLTYSFPCQDLSSIGARKGMEEGSGTRSSLLWEVGRLLKTADVLPKVLILENVKELVNKKNMPGFNRWIDFLSDLGYVTTWKIVNSVDFGIPQNRRRVFAVSVLNSDNSFEFPTAPISMRSLGDLMDDEKTVTSEFGAGMFGKDKGMLTKIWKTINNTQSTNSTNRIYCKSSILHALTTQGSHPGNFGAVLYWHTFGAATECPLRNITKGLPIEQLTSTLDDVRLATPREYFRLMGFNDTEFDRAKQWCVENNRSFSNLYHVAGNSIVVNVLVEIFRELHIQWFI